MLNEILTRIHVAHDQAMSAACLRDTDDTLTLNDRENLLRAVVILEGLLEGRDGD